MCRPVHGMRQLGARQSGYGEGALKGEPACMLLKKELLVQAGYALAA